MEEKQWMKIKDLERVSTIPRSTIHFYLRTGLLHPPTKTGKTMAYYDQSHLERLQVIQKMKMDMRLPTAFIKRRLEEMEKSGGIKMPSAAARAKETLPELRFDVKQKRKQEIINAAIYLFSTKGYHRTNIRDIAQKAGISTGTFYIYYPNKRELFIEVVDDVVRNVIGKIGNAIRKEKDIKKRLMLRGKVYYDNYPRYSEILNQLRAEIASDEQWPREKVKKIYQELTEPLIREAKEAIRQGVIRAVDPDLIAYAFTGLIDVLSMRITLDKKYTINDITAFLEDFATNGLKPE